MHLQHAEPHGATYDAAGPAAAHHMQQYGMQQPQQPPHMPSHAQAMAQQQQQHQQQQQLQQQQQPSRYTPRMPRHLVTYEEAAKRKQHQRQLSAGGGNPQAAAGRRPRPLPRHGGERRGVILLPALVQLLCVGPFQQRMRMNFIIHDPLVAAVREAFQGLLDDQSQQHPYAPHHHAPVPVEEVLGRINRFQREFAIPTVRQHQGNWQRRRRHRQRTGSKSAWGVGRNSKVGLKQAPSAFVKANASFARDACVEVERFLYRMSSSSPADFSVFGLTVTERKVTGKHGGGGGARRCSRRRPS